MRLNTYCSYCGHLQTDVSYPKTCPNCHNITYVNPIPVAVMVVRTTQGVLLGKRAIEPMVGHWALVGGYMDLGEDYSTAARRELWEETGINYEGSFSLLNVYSSTSKNQILIFVTNDDLIDVSSFEFVPNSETSEIKYVSQHETLAFSTHTIVLDEFFCRSKK